MGNLKHPTLRAFLVMVLAASFTAVTAPRSTPPADACPMHVWDPATNTAQVVDCGSLHQQTEGSGAGGGGSGNGPICWVKWSDSGNAAFDGWMRIMFETSGYSVPGDADWWYDRCARGNDDPDDPCWEPPSPDFDPWEGNACGAPNALPFVEDEESCNEHSDSAVWYEGYGDGICMLLGEGFDPVTGFFFSETVDIAPGQPWEVYLLQEVWAEAEARLVGPEVELHPPAGEPAIVHIPAFVSLPNVDQIEPFQTAESCAPAPFNICVSIDATPDLTFDPGDGTGAFPCDGRAYDPSQSPRDQVNGACAHEYTQHSSDPYPGRVEVTWTVVWHSSSGGGMTGTFDPIVLPADDVPNAPRVVEEVQSIVTDLEFSG